MLSTDGAESLLAKQREPSRYGRVEIASGSSLRAALATDLHSSVDGRGLGESDLVPQQHQWVAEGTSCCAALITSVRWRFVVTFFPQQSVPPGVAQG